MEVHQHTHTPRKKWTHYFWEFLMLFLAVFCGFLAEYQLEHKIEKDRAKEYARALYDDIVSDTANLKKTIENVSKLITYEDTLIDLLDKMNVEKVKVAEAKLYHYALLCQRGSIFSIKTSTLTQLKNSGALRLFKSSQLIRLVAEYDQTINNETLRLDDNQYTRDEQNQSFHQVFNYSLLTRVERLLQQYPNSRDSILNLEMPLLNRDEKSLSDLFYAVHLRRDNLNRRVEKFYTEPLEAGIKLIRALKEEYHLQ